MKTNQIDYIGKDIKAMGRKPIVMARPRKEPANWQIALATIVAGAVGYGLIVLALSL